MKVTYTLDGKTVTPGKIAGKSGRVTVRYDFDSAVFLDGVKVPFASVVGAVLDNDVFRNIEVYGGKKEGKLNLR